MKLNPMDIFVGIIALAILFIAIWLLIDYILMIRRHKKWERGLDEDTYTIE